MKKYLFSLLLLLNTAPVQSGIFEAVGIIVVLTAGALGGFKTNNTNNNSQPSQYAYNSPEEVFNAFFHMIGKGITNSTHSELWRLAEATYQKIVQNRNENIDTSGHDTVINCFLEHLKTKIQNAFEQNGLPRVTAQSFANIWYINMCENVKHLNPSISEISSPYQFTEGTFATLFGDTFAKNISTCVTHYKSNERQNNNPQTITTLQKTLLITNGIIIVGKAIIHATSSSSEPQTPQRPQARPQPTPAPVHRQRPSAPPAPQPEQEYHHYDNPYYAPPVAKPIWEQGGIRQLNFPYIPGNGDRNGTETPSECVICSQEKNSRLFCPYCGTPACKDCWYQETKRGRYCPQQCFLSRGNQDTIEFWKKRIQIVLEGSTKHCVLCLKMVNNMRTLPRCRHKLCRACENLWQKQKMCYSETCPCCAQTAFH